MKGQSEIGWLQSFLADSAAATGDELPPSPPSSLTAQQRRMDAVTPPQPHCTSHPVSPSIYQTVFSSSFFPSTPCSAPLACSASLHPTSRTRPSTAKNPQALIPGVGQHPAAIKCPNPVLPPIHTRRHGQAIPALRLGQNRPSQRFFHILVY
ncbi:hypothetical protein CCMA1212_001236 [Trichoderma ghanense]|uniref:Uncharacterized protein n=1 Tax=Trichoderma ghanense TaxID=65468 RepID=A0ABY2HEW2_9HYPO